MAVQKLDRKTRLSSLASNTLSYGRAKRYASSKLKVTANERCDRVTQPSSGVT
ncbi:hypothetical protein AVDCRST_MAG81-4170 [uncultured Synechococcales cyanobacterium]|uniref:Uncharacterized protein n=1 Tax=uncultured Synechococcales cyanobacterium TaxID=1936017 RepID=A0A6J4VWR3_9CYAN|nr:hypothetical protein AVDCRST_MAG81-4170 [uncultured Synechococcales cyanobacterium]